MDEYILTKHATIMMHHFQNIINRLNTSPEYQVHIWRKSW